MKNVFDGILCLPVTPFKKDEVDTDTLRKIIDVIIEDGADGLVPTGATGEFPYLLHDERKKTWETVVDETNGRAKVIAGTGAISTKEAIQFTKKLRELSEIPVILYTGSSEEKIAEEAFEAGADDFVTKAHDAAHYIVLLKRIKNAVDKYRIKMALEKTNDEIIQLKNHEMPVIGLTHK